MRFPIRGVRSLVTITGQEKFPLNLLPSIIGIRERHGFTFVPFVLFGEPFEKRERASGDLFNRLFDYVGLGDP